MNNGKEYIGLTKQGIKKRVSQHFADAKRRSNRSMIARAIRRHGRESFLIYIVCEGLTFDEAIAAERREIAERGTVCPGGYNLTSGGDGAQGNEKSSFTKKRIGKISSNRSEETLRRIAESLRGKRPNAEARAKMAARASMHRHSSETKARIAAAHRGRPMPLMSKEKQEKRLAKVRAKMVGRPKTAEHRAAIAAGRKGMKFSVEHRANIGKAQRGRRRSPESIERHRLALLGQRRSPESIERMRIAAQARVARKRQGAS